MHLLQVTTVTGIFDGTKCFIEGWAVCCLLAHVQVYQDMEADFSSAKKKIKKTFISCKTKLSRTVCFCGISIFWGFFFTRLPQKSKFHMLDEVKMAKWFMFARINQIHHAMCNGKELVKWDKGLNISFQGWSTLWANKGVMWRKKRWLVSLCYIT